MNGQTKFVLDKLKEIKKPRVLNIGFRHDSDMTIRDHVRSLGGTFEVLEAYGPNCQNMINLNSVDQVYELDVRNIEKINDSWDAIIWLHGPEHIYWDEFLDVRTEIEQKAKKLIIYQAPIGEHPQGELYNNPFEAHVQTLHPEMFQAIGYEVYSHDGSQTSEYDFLKGENTFSAIVTKEPASK